MAENLTNLNLESLINSSEDNKIIMDLILNNLPFGLSVQNRERKIIYENNKAKDLTGSFHLKHCYNRWAYLPEEGLKICKDCPATISLIDHTPHKIFRKTLNRKFKDLFIEIQVIPILEKEGKINNYIEILNDISEDEIARSQVNKSFSELIANLSFSISKYGTTGGEVILNDELPFLKKKDEYIQKLTMFTYIGVFQNNFNQEGLFGPLPVLDIPTKSMLVYSFRTYSQEITDPRRNGQELCLFIIYFDRENYFLFEKRNEILKFLNKKLENKNLSELKEVWFLNFKKELINFLSVIFNNFKLR